MKGLILKDIYNMKSVIRIYLLFPIIAAVIGYMDGSLSFLTTLPIFASMFFVISAFAYDEYSHFDEYALTLPLGRKELVKSKYILSILVLGSMLVCVAILSGLMVLCFPSKFPDLDLMEQCVTVMSFSALILLIMAIQFPIIFRFGTEKARILMIVCFLGITAFCGYFLQLIDVELLALTISDMTVFIWVLIGCVVSIVVFIASYFLSLRLIMKKEF